MMRRAFVTGLGAVLAATLAPPNRTAESVRRRRWSLAPVRDHRTSLAVRWLGADTRAPPEARCGGD